MMWFKDNRWGLLTLAGAIAFVMSLPDVVGKTLADSIMWGVGGWQLGAWAQALGKYLKDKYDRKGT